MKAKNRLIFFSCVFAVSINIERLVNTSRGRESSSGAHSLSPGVDPIRLLAEPLRDVHDRLAFASGLLEEPEQLESQVLEVLEVVLGIEDHQLGLDVSVRGDAVQFHQHRLHIL